MSVLPSIFFPLHLSNHCIDWYTDACNSGVVGLTGYVISCWPLSNSSWQSFGHLKYILYGFHYDLDVLTVNWTLWLWIGFQLWDLEILQTWGQKLCSPINYVVTQLSKSQTIWLNGAMFLTISPFLVIDDNTIKASIKFARIEKLNHLHLFGCCSPSNVGLASP